MTRDEFHNILIGTIADAISKTLEPFPPNLDWKNEGQVQAHFAGWARKYAEAQCRLHAAKLKD